MEESSSYTKQNKYKRVEPQRFYLCDHVSSPNAPVIGTNKITHITKINKIWPQNYL